MTPASAPALPAPPLDPAPPPASPVDRLRALLPRSLRGRLQSARELQREIREADREPLPTALPALDRLLAGGLPRGQLVELVGSRSSGRFSTVLQVLAAATGVGEAAALVDLGDGLDPAGALAMGIDLARLLWLRPRGLKQALAAAEMVIGSGFPLVALDLGSPPLGGGKSHESAWLRLARAAKEQGCALLVSSPYRVSGTAACAVLRAGRTRPLWQASWPLLGGTSSHLILEKFRGHTRGDRETLTLSAHGSLLPSLPAPPSPPSPGIPARARGRISQPASPREKYGREPASPTGSALWSRERTCAPSASLA